MIPFGAKAKDSITGFEGVVTAYSVYMNGCIRYLVEAKSSSGAIAAEQWIDEQRLVASVKRRADAIAGGPMPAPRAMSTPPK
jgi:hypothetical protein